jgi:Common central domain of tyrosinase
LFLIVQTNPASNGIKASTLFIVFYVVKTGRQSKSRNEFNRLSSANYRTVFIIFEDFEMKIYKYIISLAWGSRYFIKNNLSQMLSELAALSTKNLHSVVSTDKNQTSFGNSSFNPSLKQNQRFINRLMISGVLILCSACTTGFHDGMRVVNTASTINMSGYITESGASGADVRISAFNVLTNMWDVIRRTSVSGSISNTVSFTMADGTKLYFWNAGANALPAQYWKSGTGGSFARVRAEWYKNDGTLVGRLLNPRRDWGTCFFENVNGKQNTLEYLLPNCFTHRSEAYVYTQNYREGSILCPAPAAGLVKRHGHYMLTQIPDCAKTIVSNHMREPINRSLIDGHYEIEHNSAANAHSVAPVTIGATTYDTGGFFGGHENYIRKMERHVMVYDYPWMPVGKIPSWDPATTVPVVFRTAVASPNGNCQSTMAGCTGWLSGNIGNATPNITTPNAVSSANICGIASSSNLHGSVNGWHGGVHVTVGNNFSTFDSPSFPLFFLWHNYVEDLWRDWKNCP